MRAAARIDGLGTTVFTEMTALAQATGAINLGQGFPDVDGPSEAIDAAISALRGGHNQYAPLPGVPPLREAVLAHQRERYGLEPEDVLITFGATEAIAAALLALVTAGDEVLVLEPFYDSYVGCIQFTGAKRRAVTLRPPDFQLDGDELRAQAVAAGASAKVLLLNSPHNPTGRVFDRQELEAIAEVCIEHDLICITDEVYEHLVYEGEHIPISTLPGMASRTLTVSSIGKSFSFTGWKVGWVTGPAELVGATRTVKQFLTFAGGTPLQYAAAVALTLPDRHVTELCRQLRANRDRLALAITRAGWSSLPSQGTYFINADVGESAEDLCRQLPELCGIVAIPTNAFYDDKEVGRSLVRFAFCKRPEVIEEAATRLERLACPEGSGL